MVCILPCCPCQVSTEAVPFVPMPQMSSQTAESFENVLGPAHTASGCNPGEVLEQTPMFTYGDDLTVEGIGKQVQYLTQVLRLVFGANS